MRFYEKSHYVPQMSPNYFFGGLVRNNIRLQRRGGSVKVIHNKEVRKFYRDVIGAEFSHRWQLQIRIFKTFAIRQMRVARLYMIANIFKLPIIFLAGLFRGNIKETCAYILDILKNKWEDYACIQNEDFKELEKAISK